LVRPKIERRKRSEKSEKRGVSRKDMSREGEKARKRGGKARNKRSQPSGGKKVFGKEYRQGKRGWVISLEREKSQALVALIAIMLGEEGKRPSSSLRGEGGRRSHPGERKRQQKAEAIE